MVGYGGESGVKDRGNSAVAGGAVYGSCSVVVVIGEWEFGDNGGNTQSDRGISSLGSQKDYGDNSTAYTRQVVGGLQWQEL